MTKLSKMLTGITIVLVTLVGVSIYTVNTYNNSNPKTDVKNKIDDKTTTKTDSNNITKVIPNVIKTKAIDFKLKDLNGKEMSLSDLKGKKVFLNFWATWCPPCKEEMPEIQKLYRKQKIVG